MNNIKLLREERGWKQSELGKLLNVKASAVSKYENGGIPLTGETLCKLANIFDVSTDFILGRTTQRNYKGTSFEPPQIVELLSNGDLEFISGWKNLSPESQDRLRDFAQILQKAEAADTPNGNK